MKKIFFLCFLLTGCASPFTDAQINAMNNEKLCAAVQARPDDFHLLAYMTGRKLHCHPFQINCLNAGYKINSKDYKNCLLAMIHNYRQELAQRQSAIQSIGNAMQGVSQYYNQRSQYYASQPQYIYKPPTQTSCTTIGAQTNCSTY